MQLVNVDATGNIITGKTDTIQNVMTSDTEFRVKEDLTNPNTAGWPTLKEYIVAEEASGLFFKSINNYQIVTSTILPSQVAGLAGWYDAADTATITAAGGLASQWDDKSGLGNHVVQGTTTNKPATGFVTLNGKNTISFAGGDNSTGSWMLRTGMSETVQEFFMVMLINGTQVRSGCCLGIVSNGGDRGNVRMDAQTNHTFRFNNDSVIPGAPGDANDFGTLNGLWDIDDNVSLLPTDDVFQRYFMTRGSAISSPTAVYTNFRIGGDPVGGGRHATFDLAELIAYNTSLTAAVRTNIKAYLDLKWGLN